MDRGVGRGWFSFVLFDLRNLPNCMLAPRLLRGNLNTRAVVFLPPQRLDPVLKETAAARRRGWRSYRDGNHLSAIAAPPTEGTQSGDALTAERKSDEMLERAGRSGGAIERLSPDLCGHRALAT